MAIPVGSPALEGAFNPFDESIGGIATLPFVYAPAPSGGDDRAMIQLLINTYNPLAILVRLRQGDYLVSAELAPAVGFPLLLCGASYRYNTTGGTSIKLTQAARSVLAITEKEGWIQGIRFDANRLGSYGIYAANALGNWLFRGATTNALLDGIHISTTGLNQAIKTLFWMSYENGKLHATAGIRGQYANNLVRQAAIAGTAAITAGGDTITFTGAPDLTTLGIRVNDMLRVGAVAATSYYGQILSVTSTTIVVQPLTDNRPTATASGLDYAIGIGSGWYPELASTNGFCYLDESWWRGNGAMGVVNNALYGEKVRSGLCDTNCSGGIAFGQCWNGGTVQQALAEDVYMEFNVGPDYVLGNCDKRSRILRPGGGSAVFSICGSQFQGKIDEDSVQLGADQNFLFEVTNVAGTIKHRFSANHFGSGGFASLAADKVSGAIVGFTTTPTVDATHDFAAGAGLFSAGGVLVALLNTPSTQNLAPDGMVRIEFDDTGVVHGIALEVQSAVNVNGVTRNWTAFYLLNSSGAIIDWNAANIAAGKTIGIRFNGKLK